MRLKLFLILRKSVARVLKKVVLKKKSVLWGSFFSETGCKFPRKLHRRWQFTYLRAQALEIKHREMILYIVGGRNLTFTCDQRDSRRYVVRWVTVWFMQISIFYLFVKVNLFFRLFVFTSKLHLPCVYRCPVSWSHHQRDHYNQ